MKFYEYAFPDETFYRLFDRETKTFYTTKEGKTFFTSLGHIKSSLKQRYGKYSFAGYKLPEDFNYNKYLVVRYTSTLHSVEVLNGWD